MNEDKFLNLNLINIYFYLKKDIILYDNILLFLILLNIIIK